MKLKYLTKFSLFDVYRGKPLSEEQKSFALTFYFQSESKTLSDKEVELEVSQIINYLNKSIGAELRWNVVILWLNIMRLGLFSLSIY